MAGVDFPFRLVGFDVVSFLFVGVVFADFVGFVSVGILWKLLPGHRSKGMRTQFRPVKRGKSPGLKASSVWAHFSGLKPTASTGLLRKFSGYVARL
jgi:hypothetical protein